MSGYIFTIWLFLTIFTAVPSAICQGQSEATERPAVPRSSGTTIRMNADTKMVVPNLGLCRDGWSRGTMKEMSGKEIPICVKVNPKADTWKEAQATCRKHYGFLLKLGSNVQVNNDDLYSLLDTKGITRFWTGMHTEHGHLVWDDLLPYQVRPHNSANATSTYIRPWAWENDLSRGQQQYCGQLHLESDDDDRRRRKRSPDDDSNDNIFPGLNLANFRHRMSNAFGRRTSRFPPTSAFQTLLARTQMSDQLAELPGALDLQDSISQSDSNSPDSDSQNSPVTTEAPSFGPMTTFDTDSDSSVVQFGAAGAVLGSDSNGKELLDSLKEVAATLGPNIEENQAQSAAAEDLINIMSGNADAISNDNPSSFDITQSDTGSQTTDTLSSFEKSPHDTSVSVDKTIHSESEIIDKVTDVTSSPIVTSAPDDESKVNIGDILSITDDNKPTGSELLGAVTGSDDALSNIGDSQSLYSDDSKTSSDAHGTDIVDTVMDNLNDSPTDMTDIIENVVDSIMPSTDESIGDVSSPTLDETPSHTNDAIDDLISSSDNEAIPNDGILSGNLAAVATDDIVPKSVDSADVIKDIVSDIKDDITEGILDDSITPLDDTVPESNVDDVIGSDDQIVPDLQTDDVSEILPDGDLSQAEDVIEAVDLEKNDETMNPMVTSDDGITDIGNIDISDDTGELTGDIHDKSSFPKLGESKLGESDLSDKTETIQNNLESNLDSLSEISDSVSDNDLHNHDTTDTFDIDTNSNTGDLIDSLTDNDQTLHDVEHDISPMETSIDDNGNEEITNDDARDNFAEMSEFLTPNTDVSTNDGGLLTHNEVELDNNDFVEDLVDEVKDNDLIQDVIDAPDSMTDVEQEGKDGIEDYKGTTAETELADEIETKRDLEWPDGSEWENDNHDVNSGKLGTASDDTEPDDGNNFNQNEFRNRQAVVDGSFEFSNNDDPTDVTATERDGSHDFDDYENDTNDLTTARVLDSNFDDQDEGESFDGLPDMSEDVVVESEKYAISPNLKGDMQLSSCDVKLPSVCFSYEVLVSNGASTCEDGWYGHVSLDTCYKVLRQKMSYSAAVANCKKLDARVIIASTEFERKYSLMAVQLDGVFHRGEKFWMESPNEKYNCKLFSERGVEILPSCRDAMNVICVKDAKPLSVYSANQIPVDNDLGRFYDENGDYVIFSSASVNNNLPCRLTSTVSEFPVLWYKDGVMVSTFDNRVSNDLSLQFNDKLLSAFSLVTDRSLTKPTLQGQYWCEVWDRQTLTRMRSRAFNVRFSDVISFHGSMEVDDFSEENGVLFNMMNQKFPKLSAAEADIQKVFNDVLPSIKTYVPNVESVFTYIDGVRSNPTVVEYHAFFTMSRDYTPNDEQLVYNRLKAGLRSKLGNRNYIMDLPGRTPIDSFRTMSLQSTVSCPAASLQTSVDIYGQKIPVKEFSFPTAKLGEFANSVQNCSQMNTLPAGSARCLGDFYTGAYWSEVVANECVEEYNYNSPDEQKWAPSPYTAELTHLAQAKVDSGNAEKLVSEVAQIAKVAPKFTPTDINKIADVLEHTTKVRNLPKKVGENVLKTVDRLMTDSFNEAHVANVETKAANRIIKSLERFAENADLGTKKQVRFVSDNVAVEIWDLKQADQPVIGLAVETKSEDVSEPFKTESIATVYNKSHLYDANVDAAIELPEEVFSKKEKGARVSDRLTMIVFRKSELFQAAITDGGRRISPTDQQMSRLNSYVISASIAGKKIEHLNERVKCIFKPKRESDGQNKCVWWDFAMNGNKGGWSNKGCVYDGMINGRDVCLCDHLTNFAVLIDFYGQGEPIPDHHELSLSIITVLGLSCSILGLSLTIISFMFFRKLRKGRAQQTLFNLSLSLLLSMLVFLVGVKQTHNDYVCIIVAILLHYLILVSFMWMLMEAILQYLTFVKILGTYITRFMLKTVVPAWGLPLLPVISVLSIDYTLYKGGPNYCWMDLSAFYYAFAVPITCIIVINITIFIVTIVSIFRRGKGLRSNQKKQKMAMTNLQAAITSFILLGLTWIFGYLAISDARLLFQYVFTILNSLQGFFIFILFVVRKKKVRDQWYIICCKGSDKDRVSRSLSASNSIPSTYSNGSRNSRKNGRERDRSDSTKTIQSTYSNSSSGFTNYGYDHSYEFPFNRQERRAFRNF